MKECRPTLVCNTNLVAEQHFMMDILHNLTYMLL